MTTPREAFKLGFLLRCAEEQLTPEQIASRVEKAGSALENAIQHIGDKIQGQDWKVKGMLATGAVAAPILAGVGIGRLARHLKGDFVDPEDVKKQELINEMNNAAARSQISQSKALGL